MLQSFIGCSFNKLNITSLSEKVLDLPPIQIVERVK